MQIRNLNKITYSCPDASKFDIAPEDNLRSALIELWDDNGNGWLLGHDNDGLIWGKICNSQIIIAHDVEVAQSPYIFATSDRKTWGAPLRTSTLQSLRLFNDVREIRIWRTHLGLKATTVTEAGAEGMSYCYDEKQILLAGKCLQRQEKDGVVFSLIEGPAGQKQAMPVDWDGQGQKYRLAVRHYLQPEGTSGMLQLIDSRLLGLTEL